MFLRGISMKKLLEVLRLHYEGKASRRQIEQALNISRRTVSRYINMFEGGGLTWPLSKDYQNEVALIQRLKPGYTPAPSCKECQIDFVSISKELRVHKNLTLQLLHTERMEVGSMPYSYSNFALLYRKWLGKQPKYMRQIHKSGEKVFVDYVKKAIM